jgi:hypothetical protein
MKRVRQVLTNTRIDRHHERLAREGLEKMVAQINTGYMPLWHEHDPRVPPMGRVAKAYLQEESHGETSVIGEIELFEPHENIPYDPSRRMFIESAPQAGLQLSFDRSYRDPISQALIQDISDIFGNAAQASLKKAFEPVSILELVGSFVLGGISAGFLKEIGADSYKLLKEKIKLLLARRKEKKKAYVFRFVAIISLDQREVEVDLLVSSPSIDALERLFHSHLAAADKSLLDLLPRHPEIQRVVFDASGPKLQFQYAVRSDAVPFFQ